MIWEKELDFPGPGNRVKMKTINMIKTYYPHWGKYTAFNSFLRHFDRQQFNISIHNTPIGNRIFGLPFFGRYFQKMVRPYNVREYKFNDFRTEISVLVKSLFKKIDVIHLIDAEHSLMFLPQWYKKFRFLRSYPKIVAMFHQPPAILESLINIEIVRQVDCVLVVSPSQADYFKQFLPSERVKTILLGVDTEHFTPSSKEKNSKKFVCLAGGVWLRDYDTVFKTAKMLENIPEIEFHIISSDLVVPSGLKNVVLHKNIPDSELYQLYNTSDILFIPFKDATANTFLMEGSACGLPIVSTDLISIKTYFPGPEAILVRDNNPETFCRIISGLFENPGECLKMSKMARQRALQLSWKNIVPEYENLYLNL
jgi:glycosyltransferase involved in cell wall biosynthesis